jgi:amidase
MPDRSDDLAAGTLVAMLAEGRVSATELLEAAIARIEAFDGPINAVVVQDLELAPVNARDAHFALAGL